MGGKGSGRKLGSKDRKWIGAPSKLTQEIADQICELIRVGNYLETACNVAGVPPQTARRWLKKGANDKDPDSLHARFCVAFERSEGEAEASAIMRIRQHAARTWQAEAWYLERKFPMKWGRWQRTPEEGDPGQSRVVLYLPGTTPQPNQDDSDDDTSDG